MSVIRPLVCSVYTLLVVFFYSDDSATPYIYTLSLHDALPILSGLRGECTKHDAILIFDEVMTGFHFIENQKDRKSTRLNSSHTVISYAVFCLKKKKPCEVTITSA